MTFVFDYNSYLCRFKSSWKLQINEYSPNNKSKMRTLYKLLSVMVLFAIGSVAKAQYPVTINSTNFPDANFRKEVTDYEKTYGNGDGSLSQTEAGQVKKAINYNGADAVGIYQRGIKDLTGIKYFYNLEIFGNRTASMEVNINTGKLDLSGLKKLKEVYLRNLMNPAPMLLDVSNCTALTEIEVMYEYYPITYKLDGCSALESIYLTHCSNSMSSNDFSLTSTSSTPKLSTIKLSEVSQLSSVYISCPTLKNLTITKCNKLVGSNVTIGGCTNLENLTISNNTSFDKTTFKIENFKNLEKVDLSGNKLNATAFNVNNLRMLGTNSDFYFGNQTSNGAVTVYMTTAQQAKFLASDAKNSNVTVKLLSGEGGAGASTPDTQAPTIANKTITASNITSSRISLGWNPATDNVTPQFQINYKVEYKKASDANYINLGTQTAITTITFNSLAPSTSYNFRVTAIDAAGNSAAYDVLTKSTTAEPDTQAPTVSNKTLTATDKTATGLTLNWTAATDNVTPQSSIKYKVEYKKDADANYTVASTLTGQTSCAIKGLTAGTSYKFRVTASDAAGNSTVYTLLTTSTLEDKDTQSPTIANKSIVCGNITETSIGLSWSKATDNVTAQDQLVYTVEYKLHSASGWTKVAVGNATAYTIKNLTPNTSYDVNVSVADAAGNSNQYTQSTVSTLAEKPVEDTEAPKLTNSMVKTGTINTTYASFTWTAASDNITPANKMRYKVELRQGAVGKFNEVITLMGVTAYAFTDLKPATSYQMQITALDEAGNQTKYDLRLFSTEEEVENYPIIVAGQVVNSKNASNVLDDGTVSYDPATTTLTLNNASIEYEGVALEALAPITLNLVGDNSLTSEGNNALVLSEYDFTISSTSNGSLEATSKSMNGIYADHSIIVIKNCNVIAKGAKTGICGNEFGVIDAEVTAVGGTSAVSMWENIKMVGVEVVAPENGAVVVADGGEVYVADADGVRTTSCTIGKPIVKASEYYDIYVAGTQINDLNASDVLGDGAVSYDKETNTLTLTNANIAASGVDGINNEVDAPLNIVLSGDNQMNVDGASGIMTMGTLNVTGTGVNSSKFAVHSTGDWGVFSFGDITISNCALDVEADFVAANVGGFSALTIDGAALRAAATGSDERAHAISSENVVFKNGSGLKSPEKAELKDFEIKNYGYHTFVLDDAMCKTVEIDIVGTTSVNGVEMEDGSVPAYSPLGIRVADSYKGIVIQDGAKKLKK